MLTCRLHVTNCQNQSGSTQIGHCNAAIFEKRKSRESSNATGGKFIKLPGQLGEAAKKPITAADVEVRLVASQPSKKKHYRTVHAWSNTQHHFRKDATTPRYSYRPRSACTGSRLRQRASLFRTKKIARTCIPDEFRPRLELCGYEVGRYLRAEGTLRACVRISSSDYLAKIASV